MDGQPQLRYQETVTRRLQVSEGLVGLGRFCLTAYIIDRMFILRGLCAAMKLLPFLILMAATGAALVLLRLPREAGEAQSSTTVTSGSASVAPLDSIVLDLDAVGVPVQGLGAVTIDVLFDPSVVDPTACAADPNNLFDLGSCNVDFASNALRFTALSSAGVAGSFPLADVTFRAIGAVGQSSALDVSIVTFAAPDSTAIPVVDQYGLV